MLTYLIDAAAPRVGREPPLIRRDCSSRSRVCATLARPAFGRRAQVFGTRRQDCPYATVYIQGVRRRPPPKIEGNWPRRPPDGGKFMDSCVFCTGSARRSAANAAVGGLQGI